ncbi:flavin reductase family protein [Betaproteobacteria bacterium LSUCC0117]|nr:flavin reductase family protein [Betaproteobacteria bacterium LSUCC0117]
MLENTPSASADALRAALSEFATGVTIVTTTQADGTPVGLTVNSFNAVSLTPPLVLWSLDKSSRTIDAFTANDCFAVHILAADQEALAMRFASREQDRFAGLDTIAGMGGAPLIPGALACLQCRVHQQIEAGDHIIFIGWVSTVTTAANATTQPALGYHRRRFLTL